MPIFTLDSLLHLFSLSLFNPLFCALGLRLLHFTGHSLDSPFFRLAAVYTTLVASVWAVRWATEQLGRGKRVNWKDEVVVVAGGAGGVGCLLAEMLATKAGKVVILDVREADSEQGGGNSCSK